MNVDITGPLRTPPTIQADVSAFQMDQAAILTVKHGDELITSGVYEVRDFGSNTRATIEVDFGPPIGWLRVKVTERNFDPEKVGVVEGQRRFYWKGTLELEL